jgi:tripartite-type tricarboxylate transporter receptor subunit TctC
MTPMLTQITRVACSLVLVALAMPLPSWAEGAYPERPVRMIVPFPPGGTTDIVARLTATKVAALWGKSIVVENRSGASGTIGTGEGIAAPADGYTLTMGNSQTHGTNAALFPKLPYDLIRDVQPIAMLARTKNVLAVAGSSPYKSVDDLLQAGKAHGT